MKYVIPSNVKLACLTIPGFSQEYHLLKQNMLLNGQSEATLKNYSRKLALISIYYNKPLGQISETEVKEYLAVLIQQASGESISGFKHSVYSLRYYYNIHGVNLDIKLPSIPHRKKLPMVLSKEECMRLFQFTKNIKHRLVLKFIYAGGLRASEVANLKWSDIDFDRMMIHIKRGKGGKDRYLPLAANLLEDLSELNKNGIFSPYVFTGHYYDKFTRSGVRFLMNQAVKRIGLAKTGVCIHTLRHSFATHLLEDVCVSIPENSTI